MGATGLEGHLYIQLPHCVPRPEVSGEASAGGTIPCSSFLFLLPVQPFARGDEGFVEVRQAAGTGFHGLQVQGIAAFQVLVGNSAQPIGCAVRQRCRHTRNAPKSLTKLKRNRGLDKSSRPRSPSFPCYAT